MDNDYPVLYYLVNEDLKMSKGKLCAQIGHATVAICLRLPNTPLMREWVKTGQTKIVLKSNEKQMTELFETYEHSKEKWCVRTIDAGKTEIPAGSFTVMGFVPQLKSIMHKIPEIKDGKLL